MQVFGVDMILTGPVPKSAFEQVGRIAFLPRFKNPPKGLRFVNHHRQKRRTLTRMAEGGDYD